MASAFNHGSSLLSAVISINHVFLDTVPQCHETNRLVTCYIYLIVKTIFYVAINSMTNCPNYGNIYI